MVSFKIRLIPMNFPFKSEFIDNGLEVQEISCLSSAIEVVFGKGRYKATLDPFEYNPIDMESPLQFCGITMNTDVYILKIQAICTIIRDGKIIKKESINDGETIGQTVTKYLKPGEQINDFEVDVLDAWNQLFTRDLNIQLNKVQKEILLFKIVISQKIEITPQFLLENNKALGNGFFIQVLNQNSAIYYHIQKNLKGFLQEPNTSIQQIEELNAPKVGFMIKWKNGAITTID